MSGGRVIRIITLGLALVLLGGLAAPIGAQPEEELLEFEELAPGCVASSTVSDFGSGPILIKGTSHRFGERTNVAVVVDTSHPDVEDPDLATDRNHNAIVISRIRPLKPSGPEAAWVVGSVPRIDDDEVPGGTIGFDFREIGPVTFYGLSLIDHDDGVSAVKVYRSEGADELLEFVEPGSRLTLTAGPKPWFGPRRNRFRLTLPGDETGFHQIEVAPIGRPGRPTELDVRALRAADRAAKELVGSGNILPGGISDVIRVEVVLGGSSGVDRVLFHRQSMTAPHMDEDLFAKIQRRIEGSIKPQLETLRDEFTTAWRELDERRPPDHREELDELILDLRHELLGEPGSGIAVGGLLRCPDLPCGCPQLRALRAWVANKVDTIRTQLAAAPEVDADEDMETASVTTGVRLAAADAAAYFDQAFTDSGIALAQSGGAPEVDCEGTFWDQFFCQGMGLFDGVGNAVASLLRPSIRLEPDTVLVADQQQSCASYRLAPLGSEYSHVETAILPGESRKVPRGLYCVLCRTADGVARPYATLDLVEDEDAGPRKFGAEGPSCTAGG